MSKSAGIHVSGGTDPFETLFRKIYIQPYTHNLAFVFIGFTATLTFINSG